MSVMMLELTLPGAATAQYHDEPSHRPQATGNKSKVKLEMSAAKVYAVIKRRKLSY